MFKQRSIASRLFNRNKKRNSTTRFAKLNAIESFPADSPGQLDVLGHDGDPLGVDGAQVGVLEHQVRLAAFLHCAGRRALEPRIGLEVLRDLPGRAATPFFIVN